MAEGKITFTPQQIDKFNDHVQNCLDDPNCRIVMEDYLVRIRNHQALRALRLWNQANSASDVGDDIYNQIDDLDGFNENPLLSLAETPHKLAYIKSEAARLLGKHNNHMRYIMYLRAVRMV